jgi:hypothetical protein
MTPDGPRITCSTSGESATIVMMISEFSATSLGELTWRAPMDTNS